MPQGTQRDEGESPIEGIEAENNAAPAEGAVTVHRFDRDSYEGDDDPRFVYDDLRRGDIEITAERFDSWFQPVETITGTTDLSEAYNAAQGEVVNREQSGRHMVASASAGDVFELIHPDGSREFHRVARIGFDELENFAENDDYDDGDDGESADSELLTDGGVDVATVDQENQCPEVDSGSFEDPIEMTWNGTAREDTEAFIRERAEEGVGDEHPLADPGLALDALSDRRTVEIRSVEQAVAFRWEVGRLTPRSLTWQHARKIRSLSRVRLTLDDIMRERGFKPVFVDEIALIRRFRGYVTSGTLTLQNGQDGDLPAYA